MGTCIGPNLITTGLVFELDAGNINSYPGSGDLLYSNTSMLLLGETTSDSSQNAVTMTATGTATASSTQYKYGTKSLYFESGSNYLSTPDNVIFQLGSGNWTIECWVYVTSNAGVNGFLSKRNPGTYDGYCLGTDSSNQFWITITNTAGTWTLGGSVLGTGVTPNTWHHLAAVRSGNTITGYVNGVAGTPYSFTGSVYETGGKSVFIGNSDGGASGQNFKGYIDDFRITKGYARYTSTFTPPAQLPNGTIYSKWNDISGNSNIGTLTNGPKYSPFNGGNIVFDGTNDCIIIPYNSTISASTTFAISVWFNSSSISTEMALFSTSNYPSGANGWHVEIWQSKFLLQAFPSTTYLQSTTTLLSNTWYNATATYSNGSVYLYINGILTNSGSVTAFTASTVDIYIGRFNSGIIPFVGNIPLVQFYNRVLTAAEVLQNYTATRGRYDSTTLVSSGLVLNLDAGNMVSYPGSGTSWTDLSSNSITGTLTNGPTYSSSNGGAIVFDGTNDYVDFNSAILSGTGDFTVSVWFKQLAGGITLFGNYPAGNLQVFASNTYIGMWLNSSSLYSNTATNYTGAPTNIVVKRSGTTTTLIINNVQIMTASGQSATIGSTSSFRIGANTSGSETFKGNIYTCHVYNTALSNAEIGNNYNVLRGRFDPLPIVTLGLILNLDAGNIASYPGSGTTWTDLSGNNNTGTLTNGPTYSSSNGGSIVFDGINDYVESANTADNLGTFTTSAWIKVSTSSSLTTILAKLVNYASGAGWHFGVHFGTSPARVQFIIQTNGSNWSGYWTTTTAISLGSWYKIDVVISNNIVIAIYINGVSYTIGSQIAGTITTISNSVPVRIGTDAANEYFFPGSISNAQIYNRALVLSEINQNYNALRGRFGI